MTLPKDLTSLIQQARQQAKTSCDGQVCNSVFRYDLNGDGHREYFTRLACGATGNCIWGIFSDRPAKLRGVFTAWFFYLHQRNKTWCGISTYTREGGNRGVIGRLANRRGKYILIAERVEYGSADNPQPYLKKMGTPKCD